MIKPLSLISILTDQVELVRQRQIGIIIAGLGASYPLVFVVHSQRASAATMIRAVSKRFDFMHRICICFCLNVPLAIKKQQEIKFPNTTFQVTENPMQN